MEHVIVLYVQELSPQNLSHLNSPEVVCKHKISD